MIARPKHLSVPVARASWKVPELGAVWQGLGLMAAMAEEMSRGRAAGVARRPGRSRDELTAILFKRP
jgi:hypothetical protein